MTIFHFITDSIEDEKYGSIWKLHHHRPPAGNKEKTG
jgi:hypothetical protein